MTTFNKNVEWGSNNLDEFSVIDTMKYIIHSQQDLEGMPIRYGILPFFRNNFKGFSVEEMAPPELLFGGNEYEGCWEWKGPVVRKRTSAYGKFFRRKAGFVSIELLPYFLTYRRAMQQLKAGSTEEMIYDIISINDGMTSTELRESMLGRPRRRTAYDLPDSPSMGPVITEDADRARRPSRHILEAPLQRLQMGGRICISDFRYKTTRKGERYGWGVAEYSTPEMLWDSGELHVDLTPGECLDYIIEYVGSRFPGATETRLRALLS